MSDLRRCVNPECKSKWDREILKQCPNCGQADHSLGEPPPNADQLITVQDAAVTLGIGVQQVRRRIRAGTLKAMKSGRTWLVHLPAQNG